MATQRVGAVVAGLIVACSGGGSTPAPRPPPAVVDGAGAIDGGASADAAVALDLDGDGAADRVVESFSGGAHCCYRITIELAAGPHLALPFDLDGGDLGRTAHYDVAIEGDSRPALRMTIATYGGHPEPLAPEEVAAGARSHRIAVRVADGRAVVDNLGWSCRDALDVLARRAWPAWEGLAGDCTADAAIDALQAVAADPTPGRLGRDAVPVEERTVTLATDDSTALVAVRDGAVVRIDLDQASDPTRALTAAFGAPLALRQGAAWPGHGIDVRRGRGGVTIGLFAATDRATYQASLAR